jgi:hypothetical protein
MQRNPPIAVLALPAPAARTVFTKCRFILKTCGQKIAIIPSRALRIIGNGPTNKEFDLGQDDRGIEVQIGLTHVIAGFMVGRGHPLLVTLPNIYARIAAVLSSVQMDFIAPRSASSSARRAHIEPISRPMLIQV